MVWAYAGFLRGGGGWGPNYKIFGILGTCRKIFQNGAISCILRAIVNNFYDKKSSQKIINEQEFFTDPFIMLLEPAPINLLKH